MEHRQPMPPVESHPKSFAVEPAAGPAARDTVKRVFAPQIARLVGGIEALANELRSCLEVALATTAAVDLTVAQFQVLSHCQSSSPAQSQLAAWMGVSPAQVSGLVEALRQRGWLDCQRSPSDRRCQIWKLTEAGETLLSELSRLPFERTSQIDSQAIVRLHESLCRVEAGLRTLNSAVMNEAEPTERRGVAA